MAAPPVFTSLDQVSTGYTVFESDQVLTHTQLNSVAEYADDQIRLSRARLSGVGVACGLRATLSGSRVRVTGGVGVTTDGDLLYLDGDTVCDRFQVYDQSFPAYPPLYQGGDVNGAMHPAWELIPEGTPGSPGRPLSQFAATTGRQLAQTTAVLLMESYRQDDDLCSGTDCDNLGARAVNTRKLLLVGPEAVTALRGGAATPAQAYAGMPGVGAERALLSPSLTTAAQLAQVYRSACNAIHDRLVGALPSVWTAAGAVLGGVVTQAMVNGWTTRLAQYRANFAANGSGIQYYYDFLKDVVDTYNQLRERLFADDTWCSPPITTFPKHLVLGALGATAGADPNRTGWYPSPVTSPTVGYLEHAQFLARRLDAQITHFQVSTASSLAVRVTPSEDENLALGVRAIPFYYAPGGADPLYQYWNYPLVRRGLQMHTGGYHAAAWAPEGSPVRTPLLYQLGRASFFRVEGVVGKPVATALAEVEELIADYNLPFSVGAVLLGSQRTGVVRRPRGVTDLHHLHGIIRQDTQVRLQDAETFTLHYTNTLLQAADAGELFHEQEAERRVQMRGATTSKRTELVSHTSTARAAASGPYASYTLNPQALQTEVDAAIEAALDLSFEIDGLATTGAMNPLDTLAGGTQTHWLPWLDQIIGWKEEKADQKLFFSRFIREHPQLEHFGGVARGGTLVLIHDTGGTVVAEAMLPYTCHQEAADEDEPVLGTPAPRPPVIRTPPVRTKPTPKRTWDREWIFRKPELDVVFEARNDVDEWLQTETEYLRGQIEWQNQYIQQRTATLTNDVIANVGATYENLINNQWSTLDSVASKYSTTRFTGEMGTQPGSTTGVNYNPAATQPRATQTFDDRMLGVMVEETRVREEKVNVLAEMAAAAPQDEALLQQLEAAQAELGRTLEDTAGYLARTGAEVTLGSEAYIAVEQMSRGFTALSGSKTLEATATALDSTVAGGTPMLQVAVKSFIQR